MCDTFVALPSVTSGNTILAKNSDREPNEAQAIVRFKASEHSEKTLKTTYIEIPQAKRTFEVILSKPFWMWGAEMGVNEKGVAIGNEAVFTRVPFAKKNNGLLGMDLLRIALERADTAAAAAKCITDHLEAYGQDALSGYYDKNFYYHNTFLIADPKIAIVLETVERHWALKRVTDYRSISNGLTLETDFDDSSKGLREFAEKAGRLTRGGELSFREAFSDRFFTYMGMCTVRRKVTEGGVERSSKLGAKGAMQILRSHGAHDGPKFSPTKSSMGSVCLHAKGPVTPSQTTGSMVAELRSDGKHTVWLTGSAAPCLSLFKPVYFGGENLDSLAGNPAASPDGSLWWRHELLHRRALRDYPRIHKMIREEYDRLEAEFLRKDSAGSATKDRDDLTKSAFHEGDQALGRLLKLNAKEPSVLDWIYNFQWSAWNRKCGLAL
ncbi:MAG: C69 family dipeptidase [Leptospirales bacterium]|nr:C69 family dipeptidase [Leptospirales bacterium]